MKEDLALFEEVRRSVPAYRKFLAEKNIGPVREWSEVPLCCKKDYLQSFPLEELFREGRLGDCFLIGTSSGFSASGSQLWLKQADDEEAYLEAVRELLVHDYAIDRKSTLIIVSLALGTWIGGLQLACVMRGLAARTPGVSVATPGMDLKESVYIATTMGPHFEQIVWISNPSSIAVIYSLLRETPELLTGRISFAVVGEFFSETFRETTARNFGHPADNPYAVKTGYGSADAGDLGIESEATIRVRKFLCRHPEIAGSLFGDQVVPMLLVPPGHARLEIVDGSLVVSKDQFIPLIRYDTGDRGQLLSREDLAAAGVDRELVEALPEETLAIFGRSDNDIVFYGTNLDVNRIGGFLETLDPGFSYGGLFEIRPREEAGISWYEFTVYVLESREGLADAYRDLLLEYLKNVSNEFASKYDRLKKAVGRDLITVTLADIRKKRNANKHRTIHRED